MELTFEQIKTFTKGALTVRQDGDIVDFCRFTQKQIDAFCKGDPGFLNGALTTTGCRIDFHTDSDYVELHVASAGKYEIMVNALPWRRFVAYSSDCFHADLPAGDKRVTIVLPSHSHGKLYGIKLSESASLCGHDYRMKLLFHGDSITQGWDSHWDCLSYAWQVTTAFDADSMILGIGGTFFLPDTVENVGFEPDAIVVAYGTNDLFRFPSLEAFTAACRAFLDNISTQFPGKKVFCLTPVWRADAHNYPVYSLDEVRETVAQEARNHGFFLVHGEELIPALPEFFQDEFLHPNDLGFGIYARNLTRQMQDHL